MTDGHSIERGYGPICATKYGLLLDVTVPPADDVRAVLEAMVTTTTEEHQNVAMKVRDEWQDDPKLAAKRLEWLLSFHTEKAETDGQLVAMRSIGFHGIAGLIAYERRSDAVPMVCKNKAKVWLENTRWGVQIYITTYRLAGDDALREVREIKGRHWDRMKKANTFSLTSWDDAIRWVLKYYPLSEIPEKPEEVVEAETQVEAKKSEPVKVEIKFAGLEAARVICESPYNAEFVAEVKTLAMRKWVCCECGKPALPKCKDHPNAQHAWSVPLDRLPNLVEVATKHYGDVVTLANAVSEKLEDQNKRRELAEVGVEENGEPIKLFGGELYPFQCTGVRYLEAANGNAIIADEQGLGKTVQAIAYVKRNTGRGRVLYVVPSNVQYNWVRELLMWLGGVKNPDKMSAYLRKVRREGMCTVGKRVSVGVLNGKGIDAGLPRAKHLVIGYGSLLKWKDELLEHDWEVMVCDEAHYLKNNRTKRSQAAKELAEKTGRRILLTGTPVLNKPKDLWHLLNLVDPESWDNYGQFIYAYCGARRTRWGTTMDDGNVGELSGKLAELNDRLTGHVWIRRLKKDVLPELPAKVRHQVDIELGKAEMKRYHDAEDEVGAFVEEHGKLIQTDSGTGMIALQKITLLRTLLAEVKQKAALSWVDDLVSSTGKVVVVARHKSMVKAVRERFDALVIDGNTPTHKRDEIVAAFQNDPSKKVIAIAIEAASVGITLTAASHLVFLERTWRPGDHDQAEDRIHRIGQDDQATIWYLDVPDTFDECLRSLLSTKRAVSEAIQDGKAVSGDDGVLKAFVDYFEAKKARVAA